MIKTHPKSKIYRLPEKELKDLDGVVIQMEHLAEPICDNYYCFIEVVSPEEYNEETKLDKLRRDYNSLKNTHERVCSALLNAFSKYENAEQAEIRERSSLEIALNTAMEWFS